MRRFLRIICVSALAALAVPLPARADLLEIMRNAGPGELGLNKTTGGLLAGAALGGLLGSQLGNGDGRLVGTAVGVLGGAWLGHILGSRLDEADYAYESRAARSALAAPAPRNIAWQNPDTGRRGAVRTGLAHRNDAGETCRTIERSVVIDGERQTASALACRDRDGNWEVRP